MNSVDIMDTTYNKLYSALMIQQRARNSRYDTFLVVNQQISLLAEWFRYGRISDGAVVIDSVCEIICGSRRLCIELDDVMNGWPDAIRSSDWVGYANLTYDEREALVCTEERVAKRLYGEVDLYDYSLQLYNMGL